MNKTCLFSDAKIVEFKPKYASEVVTFLLTILEGEFGHHNVPRPDLANIQKYYQSGNGNFWIGLYNDEVVGTVGLNSYGKDIGYLQRMSVKKNLRGTGLAQKLLRTAEHFAKARNIHAIYLATSANLVEANKFYPKEGFVRINALPKEIPTPLAKIYFKKEI